MKPGTPSVVRSGKAPTLRDGGTIVSLRSGSCAIETSTMVPGGGPASDAARGVTWAPPGGGVLNCEAPRTSAGVPRHSTSSSTPRCRSSSMFRPRSSPSPTGSCSFSSALNPARPHRDDEPRQRGSAPGDGGVLRERSAAPSGRGPILISRPTRADARGATACPIEGAQRFDRRGSSCQNTIACPARSESPHRSADSSECSSCERPRARTPARRRSRTSRSHEARGFQNSPSRSGSQLRAR